jgi:hypothetical protein
MKTRDEILQAIDRVRHRASACEDGFTEFVAVTDYPVLYRELEAAEPLLANLGIYELLWAAAEQSEGLLRADRIKDAEDVLRRAAEILKSAGA